MNPFRATRWIARAAGSRWRARRYGIFAELCAVVPSDRIVDIGAGAGHALAAFNRENAITAVDLAPWPGCEPAGNVTFVRADACALPFEDRAFDLAFSNSVIEHVGPERQADFAREVRRVADGYFVQTPNRYFPIEPHYQFPFFQFLPVAWQRWLNNRFTLGWQQRGQWEPIRLIGRRELERLFPDAEIHGERIFGLTKSLMAVRRRTA